MFMRGSVIGYARPIHQPLNAVICTFISSVCALFVIHLEEYLGFEGKEEGNLVCAFLRVCAFERNVPPDQLFECPSFDRPTCDNIHTTTAPWAKALAVMCSMIVMQYGLGCIHPPAASYAYLCVITQNPLKRYVPTFASSAPPPHQTCASPKLNHPPPPV